MQTNLAQSYLKFVEGNSSLERLVQEVIDRVQYHEGAIDVLESFLNTYEAPFETVDTTEGRIRKLKESFQKTDTNGSNKATDSTEPNSGDNGDQAVQSLEVSGG